MDIAAVLRPLVDAVLGSDLPVRVDCWDGSSSGPPDAVVLSVLCRGAPFAGWSGRLTSWGSLARMCPETSRSRVTCSTR